MGLFETFQNPPREYTLIPFWFLNDALDETELKRQLDDFAAHGVYGVVPHARMGLADDIPFMSDRWLHFLKVIVDHAAEKGMYVILYDEGMYPSGSCAGQVVAANPRHATRCLERRRAGAPLTDDEELVAELGGYAYVNTRSRGCIRGVHFGMDDSDPGAPPSGDILNPESVASFLHLTHDRHYETLGEHFGKTILAIFTDEPDKLGRRHKPDVQPWTWGLEVFLQDYLGYDFVPHLAALWDEKIPDAGRFRADFSRATNARLEQVYYKPYSEWCERHGVALTGHPAKSTDIGTLKHFQIPGQDVVWRYLEPFQDKSLEGEHATMGKCSASAKAHYGRRRNLNECFGAFGWEFTYDEMRWLTNWLLVRGVDLISPHAFYYSVRGPRRDERPPDVGPNNTWWDGYKTYADYCRRVSWLVGAGTPVCDIAILGTPLELPWRASRVLFERQRDFLYLDTDTLAAQARVTAEGITVRDMHYRALIIDGANTVLPDTLGRLKPFIDAGRVIACVDPIPGVPAVAGSPDQLLAALDMLAPADVRLSPANRDVRYHHTRHGETHFYLFTNEGRNPVETTVEVAAAGTRAWWDPETAAILSNVEPNRLQLAPYTARVLAITPL
jgi:hypothetical protein